MIIVCGYMSCIYVLTTSDTCLQLTADCGQMAAGLIASLIKAVVADSFGHKMADVIITVIVLCLEMLFYQSLVCFQVRIFRHFRAITEGRHHFLHRTGGQAGMLPLEHPHICPVVECDDLHECGAIFNALLPLFFPLEPVMNLLQYNGFIQPDQSGKLRRDQQRTFIKQ